MKEKPRTKDPDSPVVQRPETTETIEATAPVNNELLTHKDAMMHLIKSTIGGGFLAMPEAFHNAGILIGSLGTLLLGLCVLDTMIFIVKTSQALRSGKYASAYFAEQREKNQDGNGEVDGDNIPPPKKFRSNELILPPIDYPETVHGVFLRGARGYFAGSALTIKLLTTIVLVATYYGVNTIYVCIVSNTFKQLVDGFTNDPSTWYAPLYGISINWYPLIVSIFIIPMGMVRSLKHLSQFSQTANGCMLAGTAAIFYFIFFGEVTNPLKPEEQAKWIVWPIERWSLFSGSALCSLEGIGMLLHVENQMAQPLELATYPAFTLHKTMILIVLLNGIFGLCGYVRFGDTSQGSISLNLPVGEPIAEGVKAVIGVGILLTYGLQLNVTADLVWKGIFKKLVIRIGKIDSIQAERFYPVMRILLILGTIIIASIVPDIGPLISLVGSVGFSFLGVLLPASMDMVWNWYPEDHYEEYEEPDPENDNKITIAIDENITRAQVRTYRRFFRIMKLIKNTILFILGIFALIGGAYYNLTDIIAQSASEGTPSPTSA